MGADLADLLLEGITVAEGGVLDLDAVVGDGIRAVAEQFGYLGTVVDTQQDKGKDTHLDGHSLTWFGRDACFGTEQGIEVLNKGAVERKEGVVERTIETIHLAIHEGRSIPLTRAARHRSETAYVVGIDLQVAADILLLDVVGFLELVVDG